MLFLSFCNLISSQFVVLCGQCAGGDGFEMVVRHLARRLGTGYIALGGSAAIAIMIPVLVTRASGVID